MAIIGRFFVIAFAFYLASFAAAATITIGAAILADVQPPFERVEVSFFWIFTLATSAGIAFLAFVPAMIAILLAVFAAYFLWCWLRGGQTLAMKTWRIRLVARKDHGRLSPQAALLRFTYALFLVPTLIGIFWAYVDRDSQFLHDRLAGSLFRAHVLRRAYCQARLRQRPAVIGGPGDPEVRHQRVSLAQHHVRRLDVSMNDAAFVRVPQRLRDFPGQLERLVELMPPEAV